MSAFNYWPWTRHVGFICWRRFDTDWYAVTAASRALTPSQGNAAACDALPLNVTLTLFQKEYMHLVKKIFKHNYTICKLAAFLTYVFIALKPAVSASRGAGCDIIATSTSSKTPSSNKITLPPPPSSPGVPITDNCKDQDQVVFEKYFTIYISWRIMDDYRLLIEAGVIPPT